MKKTWKPTVAGILSIVSGVSRIIGSIIVTMILLFIPVYSSVGPGPVHGISIPGILSTVLIPIAIFMFVTAILSLIGGIFAIQRKKWRLALTGSIAAIFGSTIIGILATIFTVMAKDEFES